MRVRSGELVLADGFAQIRTEFALPTGFAPEVERAAQAAAAVPLVTAGDRVDRVDRTELEMVTLDPLGSTDLDQAFVVRRDGKDIILEYAIADVAAFVPCGGVVEAEAWKRGGTVYAPDGRIPQYPEVICEDAASLLPRGPRPCVLLTVVVAPDGSVHLRDACRAVVSSREQLAYELVSGDSLGADVRELSERVAAAERARGAQRIEFPEQELVPDSHAPGGVRLAVRDRRDSEDINSSLSLAANVAVAAMMVEHRVGLFRSMPAPDDGAIAKLRKEAKGLSIEWHRDEGLKDLERRLDPHNPRHLAFFLDVRRGGGRAGYEWWSGAGDPPTHAAIGGCYAHATAPLRRLADRYVLDLVVDLCAGRVPDAAALNRMALLPEVMDRYDSVSAKVDRAAIDLVEAVMLADRVGEEFEAVVLDGNGAKAQVQLDDLPVRVTMNLGDAEPGRVVRVRCVEADPDRRRVILEAV